MKITVGSVHSSDSLFFDMFLAKISPQTRPPFPHSHPFTEVAIVLSGTGTYMADTEDYPISPGDLFFFGSKSIHYITKVFTPLELLTLQFPTSLLTNTTPTYAAPSNWRLLTSPISMRIPNADAKQFQLLMGEIQRNLTEQPADYIAYVHSSIVILSISLQRAAMERNIHLGPNKNNVSILAALSYIDSNINQRITLQDAANAAMLSPSYFSALFKSYTGYSLIDYTNAKRIELASKTLLSEPNSSVSAVAMGVGFNNMSNFNRAFRKYAGCTPREYIANNKKPKQ